MRTLTDAAALSLLSVIFFIEVLAYLVHVVWNHLALAIDRWLAGELALGEIPGFVRYLVDAEHGAVVNFEQDQAPQTAAGHGA